MNRQRVNNAKSLGDTRIWTKDLPDCSRLLYHWALSPAYINLIIAYIQIFIISIVPDNEKKSKSNKYDVFKKNSYTVLVVLFLNVVCTLFSAVLVLPGEEYICTLYSIFPEYINP